MASFYLIPYYKPNTVYLEEITKQLELFLQYHNQKSLDIYLECILDKSYIFTSVFIFITYLEIHNYSISDLSFTNYLVYLAELKLINTKTIKKQ